MMTKQYEQQVCVCVYVSAVEGHLQQVDVNLRDNHW